MQKMESEKATGTLTLREAQISITGNIRTRSHMATEGTSPRMGSCFRVFGTEA